jgi:NTE family protein
MKQAYNRFRWVLLLCLVFCACRTVPPPPPAEPYRPPRIGLVLGGGAARGFAHIGVLRVLEEEKIKPDLIVGTSVGSLIGALYAYQANSFDLEWLAFKIEKDDIFDFSLLSLKKGLAKGEKLVKFMEEKVPVKNIQDLKTPFAAVAVDLNTGAMVVLDTGSIALAVRASSAIPGVFVPVELPNGHQLVDGGVAGSVAPEVALRKGMDLVITVDIGQDVANDDTDDMISIIMQSVAIMGKEITRNKRLASDALIRPEVGNVGLLDFTKKKELIQAGMDAARKAVPQIRQALADWDAKHGRPGPGAAE